MRPGLVAAPLWLTGFVLPPFRVELLGDWGLLPHWSLTTQDDRNRPTPSCNLQSPRLAVHRTCWPPSAKALAKVGGVRIVGASAFAEQCPPQFDSVGRLAGL